MEVNFWFLFVSLFADGGGDGAGAISQLNKISYAFELDRVENVLDIWPVQSFVRHT